MERLPGDIALEGEPVAANEFERNAFEVMADIVKHQPFRNVPLHDGRLLRILTHSLGAQRVVELGASTGYSGICFALALHETGGTLTTFENDEERANVARSNYEKAHVSHLISLVEGDAHEKVKELAGPIDIVFMDADKEGYLDYLNSLLPLVRTGGLIIAHNITPDMADPEFMQAITTTPELETVVRGGMSISLKK